MTEVATDLAEQQQRLIEIIVNKKPVQMEERLATGLEIKQAAIAQGVQIELDFQLAEIRGHNERHIIGDTDEIHLHKHQKFVATAGDDNS